MNDEKTIHQYFDEVQEYIKTKIDNKDELNILINLMNKNNIQSIVNQNFTSKKSIEETGDTIIKMIGNKTMEEEPAEAPLGGERSMNSMEHKLFKYQEFVKLLKENTQTTNIELSGKNAFILFLDVVVEFEHTFMKQNYLNTGEYLYFFTTDKITKTYEIIDILEHKQSLKYAYYTLTKLKDMRLSFYFGIKKNMLYYGFYNETNGYVYKVGEFKVTGKFLSTMKNKSLKTLRQVIEKMNLKNINNLHLMRVDFHTFFQDFNGEIEILDEERIKKTFDINIFKPEDLDELKLNYTFEQWSRNYEWCNKYYYYSLITDKYVHFYIKIKKL